MLSGAGRSRRGAPSPELAPVPEGAGSHRAHPAGSKVRSALIADPTGGREPAPTERYCGPPAPGMTGPPGRCPSPSLPRWPARAAAPKPRRPRALPHHGGSPVGAPLHCWRWGAGPTRPGGATQLRPEPRAPSPPTIPRARGRVPADLRGLLDPCRGGRASGETTERLNTPPTNPRQPRPPNLLGAKVSMAAAVAVPVAIPAGREPSPTPPAPSAAQPL